MIVNMFSGQVNVGVIVIRRNMSNLNWYMTVDEFATLIANTVYDCGYFKKGDLAHPEDIDAAFSSVSTAVARGIGYAGKKISKADNKLEKLNLSGSSMTKVGYDNKYYAENTI